MFVALWLQVGLIIGKGGETITTTLDTCTQQEAGEKENETDTREPGKEGGS
jgi:hypothetical protein